MTPTIAPTSNPNGSPVAGPLPVLRTVEDLRAQVAAWRREGLTVALVPTMGALHDGHLGLVRRGRELADRVVTVSEESLSRGLLLCLERAKQVVEPAGAAGVAALLEHVREFVPPVVAVLSGGNIDPLLLTKVLRHGLATAGRYLVFRARLRDHPGALVDLLGELAELEVNVLDVVHERVDARLNVDEAEVLLHLETRGPEHCDEVLGRLRREGYTLSFN